MEYLSAGVFIEESSAGPRVIQGVSTSSAGFVGKAKQGPADLATLVTGYGLFQRKFGGPIRDSDLPLNVAAFFANGGARAYIARVTAADAALAKGFVVSAKVASEALGSGDGAKKTFGPTVLAQRPVAAGSIVLKVAGIQVATDDGKGVVTGPGLAGTIDYETGSISATFTVAPTNGLAVTVGYGKRAFEFDAIAKGAWGNGLRVLVRRNTDYLDYATGKTSRFDLLVQQKDDFGSYVTMETYGAVSLTDPLSPAYMPNVVNAASELVAVAAGGLDASPSALDGISHTTALGSGDGNPKSFPGTLTAPVMKKTVKVSDGVLTVSDDGRGGFVDAGGAKVEGTINYTTGAISVKITAGNTNPVAATYFEEPPASAYFDFLAGSDGVAGITRAEVSSPTLETDRKGMYAFDRVDEILQLCIPDFAGDVTVAGDQIGFAETRKNRFVLLTTPKGLSPQAAVDYVKFALVPNTSYAALYYPWVKVTDPLTNLPRAIPPLGHVAGVFARTDTNKNVGKSPGGTEDGKLNFQVGLERVLDKGERDILYPQRINPLISTAKTGTAVWGVRTLSLDPLWKYINARRLLMFLEVSVDGSTQWITFENNGSDLWSKISLQVGGFLNQLFTNGYFAGNTPTEAYYVQCDEKTNTKDVVDAGQVLTEVGVAPNKPAEFVRFRFSQKTASA